MKQKQIKILVATHKLYPKFEHDSLLHIHVGKANSNIDFELQGDNEGINISSKNNRFCELTALFWAWKNLEDFEYIGLFHYRRFLINKWRNIPNVFTNTKTIIRKLIKRKRLEIINFKSIENYRDAFELFYKSLNLDERDIILPGKIYTDITVENEYRRDHISSDWDIIRDVIMNFTPEYLNDFDKFSKMKGYSPCNMFIMSKKMFDLYAAWLFTIVFELEKRIPIYDDVYQNRTFGFISERLLNVFVLNKNLNITYTDIAYLDVSVD